MRGSRPELPIPQAVPVKKSGPGAFVAALVVVLALGAVGAGGGPSEGAATGTAAQAAASAPGSQRPNIVFFLTDDMRTDDLAFMPATRRLIGARGMTFTDMISPHPLCCPARAELLTGQYAQNSGVQHNSGPRGGYQAFDPRATTAVWLKRSGYRTAFHGKHLNGYERRVQARGVQRPDPGWGTWDPLTSGVYSYTRFGFFDGDRFGTQRRGDYLTDRITERAISSIRSFAGARRKPFFVVLNQLAPHAAASTDRRGPSYVPPPSPRRDARSFAGTTSPSERSPAFNERDMSDKEAFLRRKKQVSVGAIRRDFRARVRSLQAVDRGVAATVRALRRSGELDETYLVFTSDNGYSLGEHRYVGKNRLFDEILSVPLLVAGPGIAPGSVSREPVTTLDLPATLVDLAGARAAQRRDHPLDGRSLVDLLRGRTSGTPGVAGGALDRDTLLIQTGSASTKGPQPGWDYRGVQTPRYRYGITPNKRGVAFLYDRLLDPHELTNVVDEPAYRDVAAEMLRRTATLISCSGAECNRTFGPDPAPGWGLPLPLPPILGVDRAVAPGAPSGS